MEGHEYAGTDQSSRGFLIQEAYRTLPCEATISPAVSAGKTGKRIVYLHV